MRFVSFRLANRVFSHLQVWTWVQNFSVEKDRHGESRWGKLFPSLSGKKPRDPVPHAIKVAVSAHPVGCAPLSMTSCLSQLWEHPIRWSRRRRGAKPGPCWWRLSVQGQLRLAPPNPCSDKLWIRFRASATWGEDRRRHYLFWRKPSAKPKPRTQPQPKQPAWVKHYFVPKQATAPNFSVRKRRYLSA